MAINNRAPSVYDAEYVGPVAISAVDLFTRGASTSVSYTDAAGVAVQRKKGFEDTNLTEDGCIRETGIKINHIGLNIVPGDPPSAVNHANDKYAFFERGYVEVLLNDEKVAATYRIKDLPAKAFMEASGATTAATTTYLTNAHKGAELDMGGLQIPKGIRFSLRLRWDRPLTLPSNKTARIEGEISGTPI